MNKPLSLSLLSLLVATAWAEEGTTPAAGTASATANTLPAVRLQGSSETATGPVKSFVARRAGMQRRFVSARKVAKARMLARHRRQQVRRDGVAVNGRGNRHGLLEVVQGGVGRHHFFWRRQRMLRMDFGSTRSAAMRL